MSRKFNDNLIDKFDNISINKFNDILIDKFDDIFFCHYNRHDYDCHFEFDDRFFDFDKNYDCQNRR